MQVDKLTQRISELERENRKLIDIVDRLTKSANPSPSDLSDSNK
jgi:hypothetical protein